MQWCACVLIMIKLCVVYHDGSGLA